MARYQVKFTKAALRDLNKAVSRYNSMLARYTKSGGKTIAQKASAADIKQKVSNTKELREYINRLNDYKKISDFSTETVKGYRFSTTKGERRTIKRLDTAARKRYKKEIAELEKKKSSASAEELINNILPSIAELKAKPTVIGNIKNRYIFEKVLKRYERERTKPLLTSMSPITIDHYLAAFTSMGLENVAGGREVYHALANLSDSDFADLISSNEELSIESIYDVGIDASAKVNQIGSRLGIDTFDLLSEYDEL